MQRAPVAVHRRSACSGLKALRNTSDARRQAAKLRYRFGPLTPSARSANLIPGDGTKNGLSRSEQKTVSTTQNNRLTGKAPSKFESPLLQRRVSGELRNRLHSGDRQPVSTGSNDDGLCPKPAHLQAPWIIGKRAFETDYCASFPGTAILAFKPRENQLNVG